VSALGQKRKGSQRAYSVRITPKRAAPSAAPPRLGDPHPRGLKRPSAGDQPFLSAPNARLGPAYLVATALFARDCAAALFDRGGHHAALLLQADGNAAWTDTDGGI
jgi:hypothetical protein